MALLTLQRNKKFSLLKLYMVNCMVGFRTRSDGNCMYRACSKLLYGKEDLWSYLRDLTSIELFSNQEFYAFHPYVKEKSVIFSSENTAFSATASDGALGDGYDRTNPSARTAVVLREALRNAVNNTFSSLLCMFALSSVTGMDITTVYPETTGKETKYSQFLNGTISPRARHTSFTSKLVQDVQLILLWSTDGIATLPGIDKNFQPNHFVPLVQVQDRDENITPKALKKKTTSKIQPKITDVFKSAGEESVSKGMLTFNFPVVESIIMNLMCVHMFFFPKKPSVAFKN